MDVEKREIAVSVRTNLEEIAKRIENELNASGRMLKEHERSFMILHQFAKERLAKERDIGRIFREMRAAVEMLNISFGTEAQLARVVAEIHKGILKSETDLRTAMQKTIEVARKLGESFGISEERAGAIGEAVARAGGKINEGIPLMSRLGQTARGVSDRILNAVLGTRVWADETGKVHIKQSALGQALRGFGEELSRNLAMTMRSLTIWGMIGYWIYQIVNKSIVFRGELGKAFALTGQMERGLGGITEYAKMLVTATAQITSQMGATVGEITRWMHEVRDAGILVGNVTDFVTRWRDTAVALTAIQTGFNISVGEAGELIKRLHTSYGMIQNTTLGIEKGFGLIVDRATAFYSGVVGLLARFGAFGVQTSRAVADMTSLVSLADEYDRSVIDIVGLYRGLLALKFTDKEVSEGLKQLSMDTLKNFAELAIRSQGMSLSWKVMVATLAGQRFTNIVELERRFLNISEATGMIVEAARFPFRVTTRMVQDPAQFMTLMKTNKEFAESVVMAIYDLYRPFYESLGLNYEMVKGIIMSGLTGEKMSRALEEQLKEARKYMEYAKRPIKLGMDIYENLKGISGILTAWLGKIFSAVSWIARMVAKMTGTKYFETAEEAQRHLTRAIRAAEALPGRPAAFVPLRWRAEYFAQQIAFVSRKVSEIVDSAVAMTEAERKATEAAVIAKTREWLERRAKEVGVDVTAIVQPTVTLEELRDALDRMKEEVLKIAKGEHRGGAPVKIPTRTGEKGARVVGRK